MEGIRISQIDGNVQLDSLVAFSEVYNRAGVLISRLDLIEQPNTYYIEKTFNSESKLIKEEKKSLEKVPIETLIYKYNDAGELTERITLHPGGDTLTQAVHKVVGVDDLLIKVVCATPLTSREAKVNEHKYFSYDQQNRISYIYYLNNGQKTKEEFYSYNENNDLIEESYVYLNPSFTLKKTYKYKKGILIQSKQFSDVKLISVTNYTRNNSGEITFTQTSFPKKNGLQTTYYQRKYWPPMDSPVEEPEISRGDSQTAEKP